MAKAKVVKPKRVNKNRTAFRNCRIKRNQKQLHQYRSIIVTRTVTKMAKDRGVPIELISLGAGGERMIANEAKKPMRTKTGKRMLDEIKDKKPPKTKHKTNPRVPLTKQAKLEDITKGDTAAALKKNKEIRIGKEPQNTNLQKKKAIAKEKKRKHLAGNISCPVPRKRKRT